MSTKPKQTYSGSRRLWLMLRRKNKEQDQKPEPKKSSSPPA